MITSTKHVLCWGASLAGICGGIVAAAQPPRLQTVPSSAVEIRSESFWNVRPACSNNVFPANGVLNMPSLTGGCTCNYLPVSQAYVPAAVIPRP